MNKPYQQNGYFVVKQFLAGHELNALRQVILAFHQSWQQQNAEFYASKAINSAYVTGTEHLQHEQRQRLFHFLASTQLMVVVASVLPEQAMFMNSQLFFDPVNKAQKNYWHRDPQYHMTIEQQQQALNGPDVVHFRLALRDEPGIELVPGSHKCWDNSEELAVRLENDGQRNYHTLSSGVEVPLQAGDLLVFSANMIHRGIYGMDRLSLDLLFCQPVAELAKFVDDDCLPDQQLIDMLECASAFEQTIALKKCAENTFDTNSG